ncbi:hypothetical protein GCM10027456_68270 [Kineosporia babensis]
MDIGQNPLGAVPVLQRRRVHHRLQQQPTGVNQHMSFTSTDPFARVIADRLPSLGRLHRLRIQDRRRGLAIASNPLPNPIPQRVMDSIPKPLAQSRY